MSKIYTRTSKFKNGGSLESRAIDCRDTIIIPQITKKFDIKHDKTINPPIMMNYDISIENFIALIIGLIDGDGSIIKTNEKSERTLILVRMHQTWNDNINFLYLKLNEFFNPKKPLGCKINEKGFISLRISRQIIIKGLLTFAINNKLPIMDRKWNNFNISK